MTISEKIREFRKQTGLALRPFAEAVGLTHTTIARFESDKHPNQLYYIENLKSVCNYMNYDFRVFLEETGYLSPASARDSTTAEPELNTPTVITSQESEFLFMFRALDDAEQQTVLNVLEITFAKHEKSASPAKKQA